MKGLIFLCCFIFFAPILSAQNRIFYSQNVAHRPQATTKRTSLTLTALNFSSSRQNYANLPPGVYFNGNFTIECWVKPTSHTNWSRIIDFGNGAGSNNVLLATSYGTSGQPGFYVGGAQFAASSAIPLNQWTHIAATLSGTTATIYINGVASGTANFPVPANIVRSYNYIGKSNWGWGDPAPNASFDDLRIWNVAKTQSEIQSSMNSELSGSESGLVAYFKFNEGSECGNNTAITTLLNSASSSGSSYNATLNGFSLNGGCTSNFTSGKASAFADGLSSATASTSAFQIKQDYPSSTDGFYWIKNQNLNGGNPFKIYADMTTDGGGWTLIMKNSNNAGWNYSNAIELNTSMPYTNISDVTSTSTPNYSIIGWADYIKKSASGFQYMLDAQSRGTNGGIWTANSSYTFVKTDNSQTNITLNTKFGNWNYADIGNTIQPRMPWYTTTEGIITTDDVGTGWWWGTLITSGGWGPSPWIEAGPQNPGIIWYWVR